MYRNISYYIDKHNKWCGMIRLDTWNAQGERVTYEYQHKSHLYFRNDKGKHTSMYNKPLIKKSFDSIIGRSKWLREHPDKAIYECLTPVREFLLDRFAGEQESTDFVKHDLRIHVLDIECAVENDFPDVKEPQYAINAMTIYDSLEDIYHCWVLSDEEFDDYDNIQHHVFNSEVSLMQHFMSWYKSNRPDIITGWNVDGFDIPYLYNYIKKLLGEDEAKRMSPVEKIYIKKDVKLKGDFQERDYYSIEGVSIIDYMFLFKIKYPMIKLGSYKLENVGQEVLGYGKLDYEGSIKDFWKKDFRKFVKYNIQDVKLVWELELHLKYIKLSRIICNMGLCEYACIYKSQPYIYGAIILQGKKDGKIIISTSGETREKLQKFKGAHVFDPLYGFYGRGVSSLDLNSLYPSIMITLNISPETKVGKIVEETPDFIKIKLESGRIEEISRKHFDLLLKTRWSISENKVIYWKASFKKGIIPKFLERLYTTRRNTKDKMLLIDTEIQKRKKAGNKKVTALINERDLCDATQNAFKIFLNTVYGQMGSVYFPMYDIDNAEAITLSGQYIIKSSSKFIDQWFLENYGQEVTLVYGDTDSNYFQLNTFVDKVIGKDGEFTESNIEKLIDILDKDFVPAVNKHCCEISKEYFHSPLKRIEFKRETFCTEGIFLSKKHYVLHVKNEEGVYKDKFKYVGVEVKKSEFPNAIKDMLKYIIENSMIERWDTARYKQAIKDTWEKFQELSYNDLGYFRGYNSARTADGFLRACKGATLQSKAAMYHNQLLGDLGIQDKYEDIVVGEKIRYTYIRKNNEYRINVIGWNDGQLPADFRTYFNIDYELMFEKMILSPLKHFIKINKWPTFDPTDDELYDISLL